jgi:hypothetical protein
MRDVRLVGRDELVQLAKGVEGPGIGQRRVLPRESLCRVKGSTSTPFSSSSFCSLRTTSSSPEGADER